MLVNFDFTRFLRLCGEKSEILPILTQLRLDEKLEYYKKIRTTYALGLPLHKKLRPISIHAILTKWAPPRKWSFYWSKISSFKAIAAG